MKAGYKLDKAESSCLCLELSAWFAYHGLSWAASGREAQQALSEASWDIPSPALSQQNLICHGKLNQYLELRHCLDRDFPISPLQLEKVFGLFCLL